MEFTTREINNAIQEIIDANTQEEALFAVGSLLRAIGDLCAENDNTLKQAELFNLARKVEEEESLKQWENDIMDV